MKRLILELSLKPFRDISDAAIGETVRGILKQWDRLISRAGRLSFLLWTGDGSELLDYRGQMEEEFEWAKWIGIANNPGAHSWDPERKTLHAKGHDYCPNPPRLTYERLRFIVGTLKSEGVRLTGKPVTVGTTFDPGPEFAASDFKYNRHPEISKGAIMGANQWVHCAAVLKGDSVSYAGFPHGIPEGTPLGTFLGRQSQCFLPDLGFDYIWFSNGFGYSLDSWNITGEVFDGNRFDTSGAPAVNRSILRFWHDFRKECPDYPIETRGSNLSTGMDLSSDAAPLREIYRGGFNLIAPVNSPWAAMNGDYGLEIVGWLSHIAELPENGDIPYRFYTHDPWWLNSPWLDRYGREPHDIYLPLSCGRVGPDGGIRPPDSVAFLTIDDSRGNMPDEVPSEVTPHILRAFEDFPDQPGLVTWIYPFDEYHDWTFDSPGNSSRIGEVFFGDWFMRTAINQGFPLNTVASTRCFLEALRARPGLFHDTILTCPAPDAGTPLADALCAHVENGGRLLLYGPLACLDPRLAALLDVSLKAPLGGDLDLTMSLRPDELENGAFPARMKMRELLSGGGADVAIPASGAGVDVLAEVGDGGQTRAFALSKNLPGGGRIAWLRGAFCGEVIEGEHLPKPDDPEQWFLAERLMRWMLQVFGIVLRFHKPSLQTTDPLILAARKRNGFFFSGYSPSTCVTLEWRLPHGVPVPVGCDVKFSNGTGTMILPRAWHRECRVFVEQNTGEVTCREQCSVQIGVTRRLLVRGLRDATVTFLPDTAFPLPASITLHDAYLGLGTPVPFQTGPDNSVTAEAINGDLLISW